jgi:hypothetical protein
MPVARLLIGVASGVLAVAFLAAPPGLGGPQPAPPPKPSEPGKPKAGVDAEVKYTDDSNMKLKLLDEKLELVTRHGVLLIAVSEIRRIEFANRMPQDVAEKVFTAIGKLNHPDFEVREAATEELRDYRERAYPQLLKALKSEDPEVNRRADELVKYIRNKVPAALLELRESDVVHTDDSKNTGRLTAEYLRVGTYQYGELKLKLHDVHSLRAGAGVKAEDLIAAVAAPANMTGYANQPGKEFAFTVTGNVGGSVYGTDVYTTDSTFATAVVHAGLAKQGETVTVRVRILAAVPQFVSSTRNGVTSSAYGQYTGFEFVRK